jgi:hypothetical protein
MMQDSPSDPKIRYNRAMKQLGRTLELSRANSITKGVPIALRRGSERDSLKDAVAALAALWSLSRKGAEKVGPRSPSRRCVKRIDENQKNDECCRS